MKAKGKKAETDRAQVLKDVHLLTPQDPEAIASYPLLTDLLLPRYVDGECTRLPAVLKIRANGTCWLVTIECPSEGLQTALGAVSLFDLFAGLEAVLGRGQANWSETWEVQKKRRQDARKDGKI